MLNLKKLQILHHGLCVGGYFMQNLSDDQHNAEIDSQPIEHLVCFDIDASTQLWNPFGDVTIPGTLIAS